ncbi:arsenate reductase [Pseudooceanicola batsensis HTCC2597]|uniref:Arsenate reductase n=1 Tax=Pseudooceanicola batsensis (strain ATCC BAA-863 / DSM 15984 / KCTC 12145 / HTCC2597) TaxID=252305 RepID=A3TT78_PSEBH|nr:arsenate reductase (glutaredoxin) [Pseudooceanicola batsensis]EAQ04855.1 arsenate reductase [Pseudooceanicola batsensis HTCC2597]
MILWHNPRCSKSRQALALIESHGHRPKIRAYLHDAPSEDEIRGVLASLRLAPIGMMRRSEKRFAELGLSAQSEPDTLIAAMAENPILIERPILIVGSRAAIGRPVENLLPLLTD